jgi:hypothetical protein
VTIVYDVLGLSPLQITRKCVMGTQNLVRIQGQSSDSDSKRDCPVWALATVLVDLSSCVPPSSERVMTCCECHIEGGVLTASRGFY